MMRLSISPWVSVSGHPSPDLALGAGTGLQYNSGRLSKQLFSVAKKAAAAGSASSARWRSGGTVAALGGS